MNGRRATWPSGDRLKLHSIYYQLFRNRRNKLKIVICVAQFKYKLLQIGKLYARLVLLELRNDPFGGKSDINTSAHSADSSSALLLHALAYRHIAHHLSLDYRVIVYSQKLERVYDKSQIRNRKPRLNHIRSQDNTLFLSLDHLLDHLVIDLNVMPREHINGSRSQTVILLAFSF